MIEDNLCKTCRYRTKVCLSGTGKGYVNCCFYIAVTGHRRGCDTENCIKYEKGNPARPKVIPF